MFTVFRQQPMQQNMTSAEGSAAASSATPGGNPSGTDSTVSAGQSAAPTVASITPSGTVTAAGGIGTGETGTGFQVDQLPPAVQSYIRELRGQAETTRKSNKDAVAEEIRKAKENATNELTQALGKALGFVKDDGPVTVEKLTEQFGTKEKEYQTRLSSAETRATDMTIRALLAESGLSPVARLAVKGSGVLSGLDPLAEDFETQAAAKVNEFLAQFPELKPAAGSTLMAPPTGSSGGDFGSTTSSDTGTNGTVKSIDEIRAERQKGRLGQSFV